MTSERPTGHELRLERLLDAPCRNVWRCWTEPGLMERWFGPPSWKTEIRVLEPHAGGASHIVMHGPNGEISDGAAMFLEAVPEQRLVFTNAYTAGWMPAEEPAVVPFMTTIIEMSREDDRTRYTVRASHWNEEARNRHKEMGFHDRWEQASDQLEAFARTL